MSGYCSVHSGHDLNCPRCNLNPGLIDPKDKRIAELEAALTTIRDTLPIEQDNYSRHVFNVAAEALEP